MRASATPGGPRRRLLMLRWLEGVLLWLRRRWRRLLLLLWPRRRRLLIQPGELGLNLFAAERLLARAAWASLS